MSRVPRPSLPPWCTGPVLTLLFGAFLSSVGVFLVVPYLAIYLRDTATLSAATVGLLLGLNYWSTRISGMAAGALAHRWGMRRTMLLGNLLRAVGYLLLLGETSAQATCAVLLIGTGAGVYFPVAKACLLHVVDDVHQLKAIAIRNMCANTGVALGPLIGMLVFVHGPEALFVLATVAFGALNVLLLRMRLPRTADRAESAPSYWHSAAALAVRRPVVVIVAATTLLGLAIVQLDSTFPLLASRGPSTWLTGALFVINAVLVIVVQTSVAKAVAAMGNRIAFGAGYALFATSFALLSAPASLWFLWLVAVGVFSVAEVSVSLWIDNGVRTQGADQAATIYGLAGVGDAFGGLAGAMLGASLVGSAPAATSADGWSGYWALAPLLMAVVLALAPLLPASMWTARQAAGDREELPRESSKGDARK